MPETQFHLISAGTSQWHRKVEVSEDTRIVGYQSMQLVRLTFGDQAPVFCRLECVGTDEVNSKGDAVTGWGKGIFKEVNGENALWWDVKWWLDEEGNDCGTITINQGSGKWVGATGEVTVSMFFTKMYEHDDINANDPLPVMGMIEGTGRINLPA